VECVELRRGDDGLLGLHTLAHRLGERVASADVRAQAADESAGLAQGAEAGGRAELLARATSFAEGRGQAV